LLGLGRWMTVDDTEELMQLECKPSVEFPELSCLHVPALPSRNNAFYRHRERHSRIASGYLLSKRYVLNLIGTNFSSYRILPVGKHPHGPVARILSGGAFKIVFTMTVRYSIITSLTLYKEDRLLKCYKETFCRGLFTQTLHLNSINCHGATTSLILD